MSFCDRVKDVLGDTAGIYGPLIALVAIAILTPLVALSLVIQGGAKWTSRKLCNALGWFEDQAGR